MLKNYSKVLFSLIVGSIFVTGCATTRARQSAMPDPKAQVTQMQAELAAKDQQIQDLQYQLQNQEPLARKSSKFLNKNKKSSNNFGGATSSDVVQVSGVSLKSVQQALKKAGYDPGPADGKSGKKTISAIKQFQKRNNLKADGVIGTKTWALLKG